MSGSSRILPALASLLACAVLAAPAAHAAASATTLNLLNGWMGAPQLTAIPTVSVESNIVRFSGGLMTSGTSAVPFVLPTSYRPATDVYVPVALCDGDKGRLWIQPNGTVTVQGQFRFSDAQCFTSLDGASFARVPSSFTPLTLQNSWTNSPFSTSPAAARTISGVVFLKGAVAGGTSPVAFTLPAAFRPDGQLNIPIDVCNAYKGRLQIETTGVASITADADTGGDPACFTSLDGVSFPLKAKGFKLTLVNGWGPGPTGTRPAYATQVSDVVHLTGAISTGGTNFIPFNVGYFPISDVYAVVDLCNGANGRLWIDRGGTVRIQPDNGATGMADAQCMTSLEGVSFREHGLVPLTLQNGWTGGPFGTNLPAALLTHNKSDSEVEGIVTLRGAVGNGTSSQIMTLPQRLRPNQDVVVAVDLCSARKGRLHVASTGVVTVESAGTLADAQCFTSLDGASWTISTGRSVGFRMESGWISPDPHFTDFFFGKAPSGVVHLQELISAGTAPLITTVLGPTVYGTFVPSGGDVYVPVSLCNAKKGRLLVHATSSTTAEMSVQAENNDFAAAQCGVSLEGAQYATAPGKALKLKNGWVGGALSTRKPGANNVDGVVYFSGAMSGGTGSPFTLPEALRPLKEVYVPVDLCDAHKGRMHILTTGVTSLQSEDGNAATATCFTSLDGAAFVQ